MDVKEFESYNSNVFNLYMMVKQFTSLGRNIPSSNQQIKGKKKFSFSDILTK